MKEEKLLVEVQFRPDLLVSPHVVHTLINWLAGEWQPDAFQQEQLVAHLTECSYCRIALVVLLSREQKYEQANNLLEPSIRDLLEQFVVIHHDLEAHDYEYIGAYAEAIVAKGREEADKCFPTLAQHIQRCPACTSTLEATLTFLKAG